MKITLDITPTVAALLATLDEKGDVENVVRALIDHAQQGVYRPGSWERGWLYPAFGEDFKDKLERGDPYGRPGCEHIFCCPKNFTPNPSSP